MYSKSQFLFLRFCKQVRTILLDFIKIIDYNRENIRERRLYGQQKTSAGRLSCTYRIQRRFCLSYGRCSQRCDPKGNHRTLFYRSCGLWHQRRLGQREKDPLPGRGTLCKCGLPQLCQADS